MVYKHYYGITKERISKLALLSIALLFALTTAIGTLSSANAEDDDCEETSFGLTANYINEAPNSAFDVTCDIGIFVDEDTNLNNIEVNSTVADAKSVQYGIYVSGADVNIRNSSVNTDDGYQHQFIAVMYTDGATGTLQNSTVSGAHRVGVLVRSENTNVAIRGNVIEGTGAKTSGWAENGVQVDQGATADIRNNTVAGHWWDGESNWASSGIMLFGANNTVVNNTLEDNEFSVYVVGDDNRVTGNAINSDIESGSTLEFTAWGVLLSGNDNHLAGNRMTTTNGGAGLYLFPESDGNKVTGNRISGFDSPLVGDEEVNMVRGLVTPKE